MSIISKEDIQKAQEQIESIINAGAPIAKLNMFDILDNYVPSEKVKNQAEYTIELYLELYDKLINCNEEVQRVFLNTLKEADIVDNQSIEKEDSFLITLLRNLERTTSIDLLLKKYCNDKFISREDFIKIHDNLLDGTSSDDKIGLRDNDLKFVGSIMINPTTKFHYENRAISYFPLKHSEIDEALTKLLDYINNGVKIKNKYDILLIPIACHGLIASLQLFKDGNTRYGRLIQNIMMFKLLNDDLHLNLNLPLVYATRQYAAFRDDYRKFVEDIVVNNNNEAWDEWFNFNLKRIQDGIFRNISSLETLNNRGIRTR